MSFLVGLALGVVAAGGLLAISRRSRQSSAPDVSWPLWTSLALGLASVAMFGAGVAGLIDNRFAVIPVLALQFCAGVFTIGRLMLGDRRWQGWLAAGLAAIPLLFWVAFAIGEVVGPKH